MNSLLRNNVSIALLEKGTFSCFLVVAILIFLCPLHYTKHENVIGTSHSVHNFLVSKNPSSHKN